MLSELSRPTVGDKASIGSGGKVLREISITNLVRMRANSVVLSNIPEGALAAGAPTRIISPHQVLGS